MPKSCAVCLHCHIIFTHAEITNGLQISLEVFSHEISSASQSLYLVSRYYHRSHFSDLLLLLSCYLDVVMVPMIIHLADAYLDIDI
jgi:hypothetical protein